mmetsp:Transcript_35591/g.100736  ORF Transcript_35591/g.100736 Transcript_35591/m.100736 type:complete len:223 (-) Transcript_35591:155-823(-)|eukprot:CAMPEP_0117677610 /NCGR_PEP_ID=MMETSP0804-20121206/16836_1 /TAXON_ID=1074897 /ORGANISM="Tetraselmis astigmatica, Strain CCMP880" /LENGTH=222 /DNA_ID=CAMNT_0005486903 /DNA_START=287 /DNA_END=955 /DNA_ORIENTATION=-
MAETIALARPALARSPAAPGRECCSPCTSHRLPGGRPPALHAMANRRRAFTVHAMAEDESENLMKPRIKIPESSRRKVLPPKPADVIHSSTYTLTEEFGSTDLDEKDTANTLPKLASTSETTSLGMFLQRADESLASVEENPPAAAKAFWNVANGPVGNTASKGLRAALNTTVKVGKEAASAAAPAGKWVAKQGVKMLFSAVAKGAGGGSSKQKKDDKPAKN